MIWATTALPYMYHGKILILIVLIPEKLYVLLLLLSSSKSAKPIYVIRCPFIDLYYK